MRRTTLITTVALAAALAVPAAASARPYEYMYSSSPESAQARSQNTQDLRSPDARDATTDVKPAPVAQPVVEIREAPGFDWGDAGIGAAGILAMVSIAGGLALTVATRRRRRGTEMPAH
jgi:hypothetical protein